MAIEAGHLSAASYVRDADAASFRMLFEHNPQPMWVYDRQSLRFLEVNDAAVDDYGYSREEFLAMRVTDIRPAKDMPVFTRNLEGTRTRREWSGPWRHVLRNGRSVDVEGVSTEIFWRGRPAVLVAIRDITDRLALEEQLRHRAFHDALTALPNRELLRDRIRHALDRSGRDGEKVAIVLLDLDGFKLLNDSLGHSAGDVLLSNIARRLLDTVRPGDTVARLGGDEFAVLVEYDGPGDDVLALADRICGALRAPLAIRNEEICVSASAGVALSADCATGAEELLRNADLAMYRAKAVNRGGFEVFEPKMHSALLDRLALETDLRSAVADESIEVHYQPMVDLRTGAVMRVEALARWRHPTRGPVHPTEFIALAEDTGLIRDVGRLVLDTACRDAVGLREALAPGTDMQMSVNVSARQLEDRMFVSDVARALAVTGLPGHALVLEITESVLMADPLVIDRLSALRDLRVRIAIDDFGTGYSSLGYLQNLPVDIVKIDKCFIDQLAADDGVALVEGIARLAQALGLTTVAEGVERAEQVIALREIGCDVGQGFHFAPPAPVHELLNP